MSLAWLIIYGRLIDITSAKICLRNTASHVHGTGSGQVNGPASPERILGSSTQEALFENTNVRRLVGMTRGFHVLYLPEGTKRREPQWGSRHRPRRRSTRGKPSSEYVPQ